MNKKIRNIRDSLKISAQKLANTTGVSLNTVQNYEKKKDPRMPTFGFLESLVKELNVNPMYFFFDDVPVFLDEKPESTEYLKQLADLQKDKITRLETELKNLKEKYNGFIVDKLRIT